MNDSDGSPLFAFQDLDYIPFGFSSSEAPYIETGPATMRAAAQLMRLTQTSSVTATTGGTVICDLGCGDGEFRNTDTPSPFIVNLEEKICEGALLAALTYAVLNLLQHIPRARGIGIDYNAALLATAGLTVQPRAQWLRYDFNADADDIVGTLLSVYAVTHVFVYLTPKQLALKTLRRILVRLCGSGVVVCCHKFFPGYLVAARRDLLMELSVYDGTSSTALLL